ncbi:MAG: flavin reductase [Streptosporangiales bacterium]|nr:flavin reductase [Streptosporangiales bacterium]
MTSVLSSEDGPVDGTVDADSFRRLFRHHAAPVAVIMTGGASPVGFTATSLVPLAADPPLVSFNIGRDSSSWPTVERAEHLSVNLLAAGQHDVATVFATSGIDRFAAITHWRRGPHGLPVLDDSLAWLALRVRGRVDAGDHAVVVADVIRAEHTPAAPLLYHRGRYTSVLDAP